MSDGRGSWFAEIEADDAEIEAHMQDTLTEDETRDEFGELKEETT